MNVPASPNNHRQSGAKGNKNPWHAEHASCLIDDTESAVEVRLLWSGHGGGASSNLAFKQRTSSAAQ